MSPQRIQRKRTRGWRMPEGAVYVGRPSRWGNPYVPYAPYKIMNVPITGMTASEAVNAYVCAIRGNDRGSRFHHDCPTSAFIREHLAGKDLACWCALGSPCHADVLLRIASGGEA